MIQTKTIDGVLLRDMVLAGAALLEKNREAVDALNVFPVPDGDTGTNMSLTMTSATKEVNQKEYLNAGEAAAAFAKGVFVEGIDGDVILSDNSFDMERGEVRLQILSGNATEFAVTSVYDLMK